VLSDQSDPFYAGMAPAQRRAVEIAGEHDVRGCLFDSSRPYLEQLDFYKAKRGTREVKTNAP
jgi:hypothetical protein